MLKNVHLKILLILSRLGIVLIWGMGSLFMITLQNISVEVGEYQALIETQVHNIEITTIILSSVFGLISILVAIFVTKVILDPISRLIDSAPRIAAGENVSIQENKDSKKKTEVDELTNAFTLMTNELRENLNEVNRQKKQIETILLHMTDGIIAFDMEG